MILDTGVIWWPCFIFNDNSFEGRITDIRRNAACLTAFEKLPIGAKVVIRIAENENNALTIEGKVVSTRETSLGRGFHVWSKFR